MKVIRALFVVALIAAALWVLVPHGKPSGISDVKYSRFERLPPPKLLYSCTRKPTRQSFSREQHACFDSGRVGCDEAVDKLIVAGTKTSVDFEASQGTSTYAELVEKAKRDCRMNINGMEPGEFVILEAVES